MLSFLQTDMSYRGNKGYPHPQQGNIYGNETLEEENEHLEGELKGKISALKSLSINIGEEVKEQRERKEGDFRKDAGVQESVQPELQRRTEEQEEHPD